MVFLVTFTTLYLGLGFKCIAPEQHGSPKPGNYKSLSRSGAFPVAQMVKNLSAMQEPGVRSLDQDDSLETGRGLPTPVFLPGEPHGQRSLVGNSPWGRKELDTTEGTWQMSSSELVIAQKPLEKIEASQTLGDFKDLDDFIVKK